MKGNVVKAIVIASLLHGCEIMVQAVKGIALIKVTDLGIDHMVETSPKIVDET